jgi:phospholipase A1
MKSPLPLAFILIFVSTYASAKQDKASCVMKLFTLGTESMTLGEIRSVCASQENDITRQQTKTQPTELQSRTGGITDRIKREKLTEFEPYVLTPHKMNFVLPAMTTNKVNKQAYRSFEGYEDNLENVEAKFQLSLKVPLNYDKIFIEGDGLYAAFTLSAWWQIYASGISKPFRETNYQPEIFYLAPLNWHPFGGNTGFIVGVEHESNGRAQDLSRSWNRIYTHILFEKEKFALSIKPWIRLSEKEKTFALDPDGDDNPDIEDYMGNVELSMAYKWRDYEFNFKGRQNFSSHYGAAELGFTFPLWGKLRGYATVFTGYGESLIDYNYSQTRFGIGISLSDIL